jgi:uncharacterized membrane protein
MSITVLNNELSYQSHGVSWNFKSKGSFLSAYDFSSAILIHEQFDSHDEITLFNLTGVILGSIRSLTNSSEQYSSFGQ